MRRLFLLIITVLFCSTVSFAAEKQDEVHVNNLVEFINAIKSNRIIYIDNDIDFKDGLKKFHNFNPQRLPELDEYEVTEHPENFKERSFVYDNYDGYELCLSGYKNLTIRTNETGSKSLLRVVPRYAYVLCFIGCTDIKIEGLVMGHTDEGYCQGGVLNFQKCENVSVNTCDLYGCGIEGICFRDSKKLVMKNTQIRDCSYQIMTIRDSNDCIFENCFFFRNRQFSLFDLINSNQLTFRNCLITHNEGTLFGVQECEDIVFEGCNMMHSISRLGNTEYIKFKDCSWSDEFGVKRDD